MKKVNFKRCFFLFFFIFICTYRLFLLDRGAVSCPDEERYFHSVLAINYLFQGDIKSFCNSVSTTDGRPGEAIIRCIPAFGQRILEKYFAIVPENPKSMLIQTAFNVGISILTLFIFFQIALILFNKKFFPAFFSTVIYSFLVNSNIFIRHILPYDISLLCFMFTIYYIIKNIHYRSLLSIKNIIIVGVLTSFGFAIYPGFYFIPPFIFLLLLFTGEKYFYKNKKIVCLLILIISALCVCIFFEIIAHIGGSSYVGSLLFLSTVQNQGSYEEGFTFVPKYLIEVENVIGVFILIFSIIFLVKSVYYFIKNKKVSIVNEPLKMLIIIVFIEIVFHGTLSVFFHKVTFFGRLLHLFYPFFVWAVVAFVFELRKEIHKSVLLILIVCASVYSFVKFSFEYIPLAYPGDVLYKHKIRIFDLKSENLINESSTLYQISAPGHLYKKNNYSYSYRYTERDFILVNFCFYYPISEDYKIYQPSGNQKLIYKAKFWDSFIAYMFEGFSIEERKLLGKRDYEIKIYKNKN